MSITTCTNRVTKTERITRQIQTVATRKLTYLAKADVCSQTIKDLRMQLTQARHAEKSPRRTRNTSSATKGSSI